MFAREDRVDPFETSVMEHVPVVEEEVVIEEAVIDDEVLFVEDECPPECNCGHDVEGLCEVDLIEVVIGRLNCKQNSPERCGAFANAICSLRDAQRFLLEKRALDGC